MKILFFIVWCIALVKCCVVLYDRRYEPYTILERFVMVIVFEMAIIIMEWF